MAGDEALRMGLANRLTAKGQALADATALARDITSRPQAALRSDRLSSYEQWSKTLDEALLGEYHHGMATVRTGELSDSTAMPAETGEARRDQCSIRAVRS